MYSVGRFYTAVVVLLISTWYCVPSALRTSVPGTWYPGIIQARGTITFPFWPARFAFSLPLPLCLHLDSSQAQQSAPSTPASACGCIAPIVAACAHYRLLYSVVPVYPLMPRCTIFDVDRFTPDVANSVQLQHCSENQRFFSMVVQQCNDSQSPCSRHALTT